MLHPRKDPRINKQIKALINDNSEGIVENISQHGGFIKVKKEGIPNDVFNIVLQLNKYKSIQLKCKPKWSNEKGVGFELLSLEDSKKDEFIEYVNKQLEFEKQFGQEKIFSTAIFITLEHTNVFGNVYFSNFFRYQGLAREKMLLKHIPNAFQYFMGNGMGLATIQAHNNYFNNIYFGDSIIAKVTTSNLQASSARLNISFHKKNDDSLVGSGYQDFCVTNIKSGRPIKFPKIFDFLQYYEVVENPVKSRKNK